MSMSVYHARPKPDEAFEADLHEVMIRCNDDDERHRCAIRISAVRDRMTRKEEQERLRRISENRQRSRDPRDHLPDRWRAVIGILVDAASGTAIPRITDDVGFVDRSRYSLTAPELYANSARRGRIAWERFDTAITADHGQAIAAQCRHVIADGRQWRTCCINLGWPAKSGHRNATLQRATITGLQAAAEYLGC